MKFKERLKVLEQNLQNSEYVPPIIIRTIVEPSEDGPKEIGAFANVRINGIYQKFKRASGKTQEQFEKLLIKKHAQVS